MKKFTLIDKAFILKRNPLFAALDLDLLLAIADKVQVVKFLPGDLIFGINNEAFRMYLVVQGTIEIRDEQGNRLAVLEEDDFFGDESLFNDRPRAYEAISQTESFLLSLSRTHLFTIIAECPSVAICLLQAYTSMTSFRRRKERK